MPYAFGIKRLGNPSAKFLQLMGLRWMESVMAAMF